MHWKCVTLSVGCSVSQSMRKETFLTVPLLRGQFIYHKIHSPKPKVGGAEDKDTICVYHEQEVYFIFSCCRVRLMEISTTIKMLLVECTVKYVFNIVFTLPVKKHIFCCIFQTFKIYMKTAWYIYILLSLKKIIIAMGLCTFLWWKQYWQKLTKQYNVRCQDNIYLANKGNWIVFLCSLSVTPIWLY